MTELKIFKAEEGVLIRDDDVITVSLTLEAITERVTEIVNHLENAGQEIDIASQLIKNICNPSRPS